MIAEIAAGAQFGQHLADREVAAGDSGARPRVEAQDVAAHAQEFRVQKVFPLGKELVRIGQRIFERPAPERRAKAHVRGRHRHVQFVKERGQMRIGGIVEDDEAGVDGLIPVAARKPGARMAAQPTLGLDQGHVMALGQTVGRRHSRYSGPDHRDFARRAGVLHDIHGLSVSVFQQVFEVVTPGGPDRMKKKFRTDVIHPAGCRVKEPCSRRPKPFRTVREPVFRSQEGPVLPVPRPAGPEAGVP